MSRAVDRQGKRYGRLRVILRVGSIRVSNSFHATWLCRCDCGERKIVRGSHLATGNIRSCGCLARSGSAARSYRHGYSIPRNKPDPLYSRWTHMRCYEGDQVCPEWQDFGTFLEDVLSLSPGWFLGRWLMRKDLKKPYSKENCLWANRRIRGFIIRGRRTGELAKLLKAA
jgi:hypothetical protein